MKKEMIIKVVIIFVAVLIILFLCKISFTFVVSKFNPSTSSTSTSKEIKNTETDYVTLSQDNIFVGTTTEDSKGNNDDDTVHIYYNPNINIRTDNEINSVKITDIAISPTPSIGQVKIVHPKHTTWPGSTNFYYETYGTERKFSDVTGESNNIDFNIVETQTHFDEISKYGGIFGFKIFIHSVGNFDSNAIIEKNGVYNGSQGLQYANINAQQLPTTVSFNLYVEFTDGTKAQRHFEHEINNETLIKAGSYSSPYQQEEIKF